MQEENLVNNSNTFELLERLNSSLVSNPDIIAWACPVPYFGNLPSASIATVGINPSNREFVDEKGTELNRFERRFPTLQSLGINDWSQASQLHISNIEQACIEYFSRNPYDSWFKKLDYLISGTNNSYYFPSAQACHLDLVPYATANKWSLLSSKQKSTLLALSSDLIGDLLKYSSIKVLVLNGKTVVQIFQALTNAQFECQRMDDWSLPRKEGNVIGYSYEGMINNFGGVDLEKSILVLGYNHNIQSSFGVTSAVQHKIRNWITNKINKMPI